MTTYNFDIVTYVCNWALIDAAWASLLTPLGSKRGMAAKAL